MPSPKNAVAPADPLSPFRVTKGRLVADSDLYWERLPAFEKACGKLLDSRKSKLELDFTAVNFISSSFVGCLSTFVIKASRLNKKVLLKVTMDTGWLFEIMGGQKIVELEVV